MNRCLRRALWALSLSALLAPLGAVHAELVRNFPAIALRGELVVTAPPDVRLDGREARLSPGARIRGTTNTLVQPASLVGRTLTVNYVRDGAGLVHEVWILTATEAAQKRASASSGRNFEFESEQSRPPRDDGKTPYHQLPRYKQ